MSPASGATASAHLSNGGGGFRWSAEAATKFRLGGPLPLGNHSLYFHHWRQMNVLPLLRDGVFVELMAMGDTNNGVNCDATWSRVMTKKKE